MANVPSGKTDYDAFGEAFARTRKGMGWQEIDIFCERLKSRNPAPNVLDVGCGSGRLLEQLPVHFSDFRYVGTDSSQVLVNVASKDFPNRTFAVADMREVANHPKVRTDAPFDAAFAVASFHHLLTASDRAVALGEFASVLASWGLLFMTNWNLLSESNLAKYGEYRDSSGVFRIPFSGKPRAYFAFEESELNRELRAAGWEILESSVNERNLATVARFLG